MVTRRSVRLSETTEVQVKSCECRKMPPAFCEGNQRGAAFRDELSKKSLLRLREPRYVNNNQEAYTCKRARDSVQPELRSFHIGRSTALRSETHSCLLFASCSNGFPAVPSKAQHKHRCSRAQYSHVSHLRATNRT